MNFNSLVIFLFLIFSPTLAQDDDCYYPTIVPGFPCRRDIVIVIDGTPFMNSKANVLQELNFIENMISNWTFGDNGVNVAFVPYGFDGIIEGSQFYTNLSDCKSILDVYRYTLNSTEQLRYTSLTTAIAMVTVTYAINDPFDPQIFYPHRPGIEPRVIAFTSTTDQEDIQNATSVFETLYGAEYSSVLCVAYANLSLYTGIPTLVTLDMENFNPQLQQNISSKIDDSLCYHDPRITPSPCPSTISSIPISPSPTPTGGSPSGVERSCNCKPEHLWLDVTVIIDNSNSMTQPGLATVAGHVLTLFGSHTTLNQSLDQSIRLSIISVADNATIVADFNAINTREEAGTYLYSIPYYSMKNGVNIADALQKAGDLIRTQGEKKE